MKLSIILLLAATRALCTPVQEPSRAALKAECGDLGVMDWDDNAVPSEISTNNLRHCQKHPSELGITSPLVDPNAPPENLDSSYGKDLSTETSPNDDASLEKRCQPGETMAVWSWERPRLGTGLRLWLRQGLVLAELQCQD